MDGCLWFGFEFQNPYREDKAKMVVLKLQALNCNSHNFAKKRS